MNTANTVSMHAPLERVFKLAAEVEDWAKILPHYRYVHLLRSEGNRKWVRMSAWRNFIPVTWSAIQTVIEGDSGRPGRILFKHIRGLVRGMEVEWSFKVEGETVHVTISHQLDRAPFPTRILGQRLMEAVVGRAFIGHIAGKTLQRIKEISEAGGSDGKGARRE